VKKTIEKHVTRAGFIIGPNVEYANRLYCKKKLMDLIGYNDKLFEIKPKTVYKKDSNSFCLVVYAITEDKDKVDKDLQEIEVGNGRYFQ